jgi:cyanophycin synthetase
MEITEKEHPSNVSGEDAFLVCTQEYGKRIIVEKFITGFDFRILIIDKLVAAAKRVPAHVIGNGKDYIQQLN